MLLFRIKTIITHPLYNRRLFLKIIANFFILFSLGLLIRIYSRPVFYELRYFLSTQVKTQNSFEEKSLKSITLKEGLSDTGRLQETIEQQKISVLKPKDKEFSIIIPKIQANAKVIPKVNAADEKEYRAKLRQGVAHALGTSFPGQGGNIFLFAHSTDTIWNVGTYNAVFYLIYKLEQGDKIYLVYKNRLFEYKVVDKKIVEADDIRYLIEETPTERLVLQACWPPGTTWKRILVFAEPV